MLKHQTYIKENFSELRPKSDTSELECNYFSKLAGECEEGWECKKGEECPAFKEQESKLESLTLWSPEWEALASKMKDLQCSSSKKNSVCCETNGGCFRSDLVFFRIKYFPYKQEHLTSKTLSKFKSNCVWKNWNNLGPLCLTNMTHAKVLALIPLWLKLQILPQPIQLPPQLPLLPHLPLQLPK